MIKKIIGTMFVLLFAIFILSVISFFLLKNKDIHVVFSSPYSDKKQSILNWSDELNLQQSHNACGPYSAMAYAFLSSGIKISPEKINREIGGRHGDGLTYPWGITNYLNQHGNEARSFYLGFLSESEKINWIKNKIIEGRPVIVLIGTSEWGHYITILGYKNDVFFKYDSYFPEDLNGEEIGNASVYMKDVIAGMEGMRFHGISPNLVISY